MAQSKTAYSTEFDSLVIGSSLSGLIAANQLEATGRKVALVEGLDALGGSCRPTSSLVGTIDHGLKIFPDTSETVEALTWLESLLDEKISAESVDAPPVTFDEGKFKPFIGFGDQKVRSAHEIDCYAQGKYLHLSSTPKEWVPKLASSFTGTLLTQSYITKIQVDDEFVIDVLINGSKRISAREVLFCAAPRQLVRLLPETHIPSRLKQRLVKGELFSSLNLDLVHSGIITDSRAVHVLKGANEEPNVGVFHHPVTDPEGNTSQLSQWTTLVPYDLVDDSELSASALKQIKRQVKRAYEASLIGLKQERIIVNPMSNGDLQGALDPVGRWPKLQNLWILSGLLDTSKNLVGSLRQARRTLASIVGEPAQVVSNDTDLALEAQPSA